MRFSLRRNFFWRSAYPGMKTAFPSALLCRVRQGPICCEVSESYTGRISFAGMHPFLLVEVEQEKCFEINFRLGIFIRLKATPFKW